MNTKRAEMVMGEVIFPDKPQIETLPCAAPAVTAQQVTRTWSRYTIEERLYRFANGAALGARRGGPLHLGDRKAGTWEIFMLAPEGYANGSAAGFIAEDHLLRLVAHYANLLSEAA